MKLQVAQSELNSALSLASRAVPSRPTHPVLANILLEADEDNQRLTLTGFDLSFGIKTTIAATITKGGATTVPAKLFGDIIGRLPDGTLSLQLEDQTVTLIASTGTYKIQGLEPEEYTELPISKADPIELPADVLLDGIKGVLFAASTEEHKQVLAGIHVSTTGDEVIEFAATDGHRLAVIKDDSLDAGEVPEFSVTIPGRSLKELERILAAHRDAPVGIQNERGQISFTVGDSYLTTRTLDGQYPAYNQLIPRQFERQLTVDRRSLLGALERIAVVAGQQNNNIIKVGLDAEAQELSITADAQDVGTGQETLAGIQFTGDGFAIAFNVKYLIDSVRILPTDEIQIQMNSPTTPAIVSPVGGLRSTHLVMPVQLRS